MACSTGHRSTRSWRGASRVRLAFVTPLPPAPTGIADYAADVLALLAARHAIDVFHDQEQVDADRVPAPCGVYAASLLPTRHQAQPYGQVGPQCIA